jgi:polar amino acid transport system substrate-binding protein
MRNRPIVLSLLATVAIVLAGCGGDSNDSSGSTSSPASDNSVCTKTSATGDLLAEVCDKGTITVSTDPAYPPQSSYDAKNGEYEGFDIDTATEIANRLGVDVAWEAPSWDVITAGGWNDRWLMSVGSMSPTNDRQKVLDFTEPYYYTPAVVVVNEANTDITDLSTDLDGKKIGVCSGCTYEQFLDKTLKIKGYQFDFIIDNPDIHGYDTDTTALQDLALGDGTRLDAVITSLTTAQGYIDAGNPVKIVGDPVFYEPLSVAFDKNAPKDPTSLYNAVNAIVKQMHADGTLTQLSKKWYNGTDLSKTQ